MDMFQAAWVAILQGATELFPVSSLGHAVIVPALLQSSLDQSAPEFLPFLVLLHVGTAVALLAFFWRDWLALLRGVLGVGPRAEVADSRRMLLLIVVATIPAVVVGGLLEHKLRLLFASPLIVSGFLVANGVLLIACEQLRGRAVRGRGLPALRMGDALAIGLWQCLALIPGLSRSGATIVGGLLRGFDHAAAAHFSFLIATPIIIGATVLEVPKLLHESVPPGTFETASLAAVVAGITALISTWLLMRFFRRHEFVVAGAFRDLLHRVRRHRAGGARPALMPRPGVPRPGVPRPGVPRPGVPRRALLAAAVAPGLVRPGGRAAPTPLAAIPLSSWHEQRRIAGPWSREVTRACCSTARSRDVVAGRGTCWGHLGP